MVMKTMNDDGDMDENEDMDGDEDNG